MRCRQLALSVVAAALVGVGATGCSHSSNGTSMPAMAPSSISPTAPRSTATTGALLAAVQAAATRAGVDTVYLGSGTGTQALGVTGDAATSLHISVSCVGGGAAFESGGTTFFRTSGCDGPGVVDSADVPIRYLRGGHLTVVAPAGTEWAVEIASSSARR